MTAVFTWALANWKLILAALLALGCVYLGYSYADASWRAEVKQEALDRTGYQLKLANERAAKAEARQRAVEAIDTKRAKELADAESENARLRGLVDTGAVRLRVHGTCERPGNTPADSPGLGDGGTCELAAASRQAYFALRSGIARQRSQLLACQDIIRAERAP